MAADYVFTSPLSEHYDGHKNGHESDQNHALGYENDYNFHDGDNVKLTINSDQPFDDIAENNLDKLNAYQDPAQQEKELTLDDFKYAVNFDDNNKFKMQGKLTANITLKDNLKTTTGSNFFAGLLISGNTQNPDYGKLNHSDESDRNIEIGDININITSYDNVDATKVFGALFVEDTDNIGNTPILNSLKVNIKGKADSTGLRIGSKHNPSADDTADTIKATVHTLDMQLDPQSANSTGVEVRGKNHELTVDKDAVIKGTNNAVVASDDGYIGFLHDFTALGKDENTGAVLSAQNGGTININSSKQGKVAFTGTTSIDQSSENTNNGTINMYLTGASDEAKSADSQPSSYWNVTGVSQVTDLTLTNGAYLQFMLNPDDKIDPNAGIIQAEKVTFGSDKGNEGKITISGFDFTDDNNKLVLIQSANGFTGIDGNTPLDSNTDLSGMKADLHLISTPSVARIESTDISKDDFDLKIEGEKNDQLVAEMADKSEAEKSFVNPETDALMDSSLAAYSAMFASSDLLMDSVIRSRYGQHQEGAFAAARAGRLDYDTRSDLSANIYSGVFGYSTVVNAAEIGAFVETGHASYDTSTPGASGDLNASGKQNYAGLGFYTNLALPVDGLHLTGYLKSGAMNNDFKLPLAGRTEKFERTSMYWGAHLGSYYDFSIASLRTRTFVSYFYDGRDSEDYEIAGHDDKNGARFDYDTLNGHRVQVGTFAEYNLSQSFRPYVGLTYERTISAKAEGTATDNKGSLELNSSDLDGNTGIFSVGFTSANSTNDFTMEVGLNGYVGQREGVTGQIQANWKF